MNNKMNSKRLDIKDLVNIGMFSVLIFIVTFATGMIGFIPTLISLIPLAIGITSGPLYMLYATKIKKPGMIFIQTIVTVLVFIATGHGPWVLLTGLISGLLGELIIRKGNYRSIKHARLAFSFQSLYCVGNWIPIYLSREAYFQQMLDMGYGVEYSQKMMEALPDWTFPCLIVLSIVGAYIGCTIGIKILKKHFVKAGMADAI